MNDDKLNKTIFFGETEINPTIRRSGIPRTPPKREEGSNKDKTTGERDVLYDIMDITSDPEESTERTKRSPPARVRTNSLPEHSKTPLLWEDENGRPKKRKRVLGAQTSPSDQAKHDRGKKYDDEEAEKLKKLTGEVRDMVKRVKEISDLLNKLAEKNVNTKVEIKRGISDLVVVVDRLDQRSEKITEPMAKLLENSSRRKPEGKDGATQTDKATAEDREKKEREEAENIQKEVEGAMRTKTTENFLGIMDKRWPPTYPPRYEICRLSRMSTAWQRYNYF